MRAQFEPTNTEEYLVDSRWPEKFKNVSPFRGSRKIQVYRPFVEPTVYNFKYEIRMEVGGFFGLGKSKCISKVTLPTNEYYPSQDIDL